MLVRHTRLVDSSGTKDDEQSDDFVGADTASIGHIHGTNKDRSFVSMEITDDGMQANSCMNVDNIMTFTPLNEVDTVVTTTKNDHQRDINAETDAEKVRESAPPEPVPDPPDGQGAYENLPTINIDEELAICDQMFLRGGHLIVQRCENILATLEQYKNNPDLHRIAKLAMAAFITGVYQCRIVVARNDQDNN